MMNENNYQYYCRTMEHSSSLAKVVKIGVGTVTLELLNGMTFTTGLDAIIEVIKMTYLELEIESNEQVKAYFDFNSDTYIITEVIVDNQGGVRCIGPNYYHATLIDQINKETYRQNLSLKGFNAIEFARCNLEEYSSDEIGIACDIFSMMVPSPYFEKEILEIYKMGINILKEDLQNIKIAATAIDSFTKLESLSYCSLLNKYLISSVTDEITAEDLDILRKNFALNNEKDLLLVRQGLIKEEQVLNQIGDFLSCEEKEALCFCLNDVDILNSKDTQIVISDLFSFLSLISRQHPKKKVIIYLPDFENILKSKVFKCFISSLINFKKLEESNNIRFITTISDKFYTLLTKKSSDPFKGFFEVRTPEITLDNLKDIIFDFIDDTYKEPDERVNALCYILINVCQYIDLRPEEIYMAYKEIIETQNLNLDFIKSELLKLPIKKCVIDFIETLNAIEETFIEIRVQEQINIKLLKENLENFKKQLENIDTEDNE